MNTVYFTKKGTGNKPVMFLHGLWGGGNYFRYFDFLPQKEFTSYFPDELGFGKSPKPDIMYTPEAHCTALASILPADEPITIVAHSFGTILAIYFANLYLHLIKKLILISPIIYKNRAEAEKYLSTVFITRLTLKHPTIARGICKAFCSTGILGDVAPFIVRNRKREYIKGCIQHTWHSYYSSFQECFLNNHTFPVVERISRETDTLLVYGDKDNYVNIKTLNSLNTNIEQIRIPDQSHDVFFDKYEDCTEIIRGHME